MTRQDILDDIAGELDGWGSDLEAIRSLSRDELVKLIRFVRELRWYGWRLEKALKVAESTDKEYEQGQRIGFIDRIDHPVLKRLEAQRRADLERASRIKRRLVRPATDQDAPIDDEALVWTDERCAALRKTVLSGQAHVLNCICSDRST
jgi:hypothetical protein